MGRLDQPLGVRAIEAGQVHPQLDVEAESALGTRADADCRGDGDLRGTRSFRPPAATFIALMKQAA